MTSPPLDRPPAAGPAGPVLLESGRTTYELIRPLEQTVHGELLLARRRFDTNTGDYVVLKRLSRECREEDYRRLMEEVAITARLRHPGIAGMHDVDGSVGDPYLVLEYVEGHRLDTLIEAAAQASKPLTEAFACYVGSEVADALHHAHELTSEEGRWLRLVHRNVSPRTIMVGSRGEVKLTDFGTVWAALPGRQPTEDDALPGNLAYASPELTRKGTIDGRTDQFSLAAVLLHLLTGRPLVEGSDRVTHELHELRQRMEEAVAMGPGDEAATALVRDLRGRIHKLTWGFVDRIRALTPRDVAEATRAVPVGLRPILRRALSPRRTDRYASCAEFGHELRLHLWRVGQFYGRPEAASEVSALLRAPSRGRSRSAVARSSTAGHKSGGAGQGRRAGSSAEGRRKKDTPSR
ncbi:serine/threonine protein kinase [Hyalangium rubrum]|uniref:Serine/threonine-protein kinase n=1 Tax=Hyalangium rubrum TaxID=3103134 RepID=A0ABU5H620_9BACT|nr:serine/threonine-protein kinase [Hyalangium sp. s54d21]MDY7228283.1 serine/threonine-protein kinase [Hyalangium sp. s54d21]